MLTGTHRREFISLQVWDPKRSPPGSVVQRSSRGSRCSATSRGGGRLSESSAQPLHRSFTLENLEEDVDQTIREAIQA